jgi:hypothetical protein
MVKNNGSLPRSNPILDAALEYIGLGWSLIPIEGGKKTPPKRFGWKQYQKSAPTESELCGWFFPLDWPDGANTAQEDEPSVRPFRLNCVVKKNINTGSYRCFGSSRPVESPVGVLEDYGHRWKIENGIKDLVRSYFLDRCPGCQPHQVDVHFFLVTVCRLLYRLIERDLGEWSRNPDGSTKTLHTMRDVLFRQGAALIELAGDTIRLRFQCVDRAIGVTALMSMCETTIARVAERRDIPLLFQILSLPATDGRSCKFHDSLGC